MQTANLRNVESYSVLKANLDWTLRWTWFVLLQGQVQGHLVKIQPKFKADLLERVVVFRDDSTNFMEEYDEVYMKIITGLEPADILYFISEFLNLYLILIKQGFERVNFCNHADG